MKFDKLCELLIESPIGQLELRGDWSENAPKRKFDKSSIKALTNPKYIEKVKTKWNKSDHLFNLYFLRSKEGSKYTEIGEVTPEFVKDELKLDIPQDQDAITVIFTNNVGDQKIYFSPWIIAHRMAHAMARHHTKMNSTPVYYYKQLKNEIDKLVIDIAKTIYGYSTGHSYEYYSPENQNVRQIICEALGTFKSARDHKLRAEFEMTNELIAQYIIQGKITFNKKLPNSIAYGKKTWGRSSNFLRKKKEITEEEEFDMIEYGEDMINGAIDTLLGASCGSIFVM